MGFGSLHGAYSQYSYHESNTCYANLWAVGDALVFLSNNVPTVTDQDWIEFSIDVAIFTNNALYAGSICVNELTTTVSQAASPHLYDTVHYLHDAVEKFKNMLPMSPLVKDF